MFVTKIRSVLVVGLALGGIGVGVGPFTSPVGIAQEKTGDQALDGLWEDSENKGGWLRFEGSTVKYHPAGKSDEIIEWTCRYNLTRTPMTIDIFQKDGTVHGIFVVERGTLFMALGAERPTQIKRDEATTLFVLKRAVKTEGKAFPDEEGKTKVKDEPVVGGPPAGVGPQVDMPNVVSGQLIVHGILERVDAKQSLVTVKALVGNDASSVLRLMASVSDKNPAQAGAADAPKLVNVPVRADAERVVGTGVGVARLKLKMEELKAGQIVMLQLAADRTAGLVVVFIRILSDDKNEKKP